MQLVTATEYYAALLLQIPLAQQRVTLAAMVMAEGERMHEVFTVCEVAARRGVAVYILFDIFTKHWLARTKKMARWHQTQASFERLERAGAQVVYYGHIGANPAAGRFHARAAIIDNLVYCFGGVNLSDISFDLSDVMLRAKDSALADQLSDLMAMVVPDGVQANQTITLGSGDEILYDGGLPHKSLIYDRACTLAAGAERVYYVSQYGPSGRLAGLLKATDTTCYYNRVWQMAPPANALLISDKLKYGLRNAYSRSAYIHAKFALFELPDGSRALLSGSHNFSWHGVAYGTKEIALYSTNKQLWQQLYNYTQEHVA